MDFKNPIWVVGEVKERPLFIEFTRRLAEVVEQTQEGDQVTVIINSSGGETRTALAIYDLLAACKRHTVGVVAGRAESCASLILQACQRRTMTKNSSLMLHRSDVTVSGNVANAQAALDVFRGLDEKFYAIYADRSGSNLDAIEDMAHRDLHFSAREALTAGLVDEII